MPNDQLPRKTRLSRQLSHSLSGRFPETEYQVHKAKAIAQGKTTSEYVRDVLNASLLISDESRKVMEVQAMLTEINLLGWKAAQTATRLTSELFSAHQATAAANAPAKVSQCLALIRPAPPAKVRSDA